MILSIKQKRQNFMLQTDDSFSAKCQTTVSIFQSAAASVHLNLFLYDNHGLR